MNDELPKGWRIPSWAVKRRARLDEEERRDGVDCYAFVQPRPPYEAINRAQRERDLFEHGETLVKINDENGNAELIMMGGDGKIVHATFKKICPRWDP
jgi:hypothetical protein